MYLIFKKKNYLFFMVSMRHTCCTSSRFYQTKGHMDDGSNFDGEHFITSPNSQCFKSLIFPIGQVCAKCCNIFRKLHNGWLGEVEWKMF